MGQARARCESLALGGAESVYLAGAWPLCPCVTRGASVASTAAREGPTARRKWRNCSDGIKLESGWNQRATKEYDEHSRAVVWMAL